MPDFSQNWKLNRIAGSDSELWLAFSDQSPDRSVLCLPPGSSSGFRSDLPPLASRDEFKKDTLCFDCAALLNFDEGHKGVGWTDAVSALRACPCCSVSGFALPPPI